MNALEKSQQGAEKSVQPTVGQFLNSAPAQAPTPAPAQPTSDVPTLPLPEDLETYPTPEAEVLPGPEVTKPEEAYPGVDVAGGARTSSVLAPSKIFDIAEPPAFAPPSLPSFVGVAKQIDLANINQGTIPGTPYDFTGQWLSNLRRDSSSVSFSDPAFSSVSQQATSRAGNWFQRLLFGSDGTIRGDGSVDTFNFMGMNLPDEGIFGNLLTGIRVGVGLIPGLTADTTRMMYSAIDPARTFGQARRMAYDWGLDKLNPASPYFAPGDWLNTVKVNLGDGPDRPQWYGNPGEEPTPPVVPPDRFLERFEATRPSATSETFTGALAKGEIPFFGLTDVRGGADGNQAFNPYAQYTREEVESWNQRDLAQQMARFRERSEQRNLSRQENPMWYALAFGTAGAVLAGRSESVRNVYNAILEVPYAITDYFRAGVGVAASNPGAAVKVFATTTADVLLDPSPIIGSVDLGADIALSVIRSVNPEAATRLGRRIEDINIPVVNRSLADMTPTIRVPGFGRVEARPASPSTPVEPVTTSPDQLQVDMPPDLTSLDFSTMNPYEVSRIVDQIRRDYPDSGVTLRQAMQDNPGLRSRMLELQQEEVTRLAQVINPPVPTVQDTVRKTLVAKLPEVYQDVLRLRSQAAVTSETATLMGVPPQVVNSIETRFQAFSDSVVRNGITVDSIIELEDIQASMAKAGLTPSAQVETRQMGLQLLSARLDDLMFYASNDIRLGAFKVPATATRMATLDLKMSLRQFETAVTDITNSLGKESTKAIKAKLDIAEKAYLNAFSAKILPNVDTPIRIPTWRLDSDVQVYGVDLSQVVPVARNLNLIDEFDSLVPGDFKPGQPWNEAATQLISDHRRGLLEDLMYAKADLHEAGKAVASNPYDVASIWNYENAAKAVSRLEQAVIAVRVLEDSVKNGVNLPEPLRQLYRTQDATTTVQVPEQIELNLELPEPAFVAAQSLLEGVPFPNPSAIVMPVKPSDIEKTLQALAKAFESAKNGVPVKTVAVQNKKLAKRGAKPGKSEVQNIHTQEAVTTQAVPDAAQTAEAKVAAEPGSPPASSRKPGRPVSPKTVKAEEAKVSGEVTVLPRGDEKAGTKRGFNKALYKAGQSKEAAGVTPKIPEYKPEMTQEEKKAAFLERIEAYKALPPNELFAQMVQKGVDGYTMNQLKEIAKSRGVAVGKKDKQGLYDAIIADFRQQQNWNLKYDAVGQLRNPVEVHAGSSTKTPAIPPSTVDEAVETTPGEALQAAMEGSVQMTRADADQLVRELVEMDNKSQAPGIFAGYVQSGQVKLIDWYKRPVELEGEALIDDFFTQYVEAVNSISRAFTEQLDYAKTDELSGTLTPGQASQYRASLMTATQRALSQLNQYVQSLGLPFPVKRLSIKNWREIQRPKMKQPKVAEPVQASLETATERPVKAKKGKQTKPVKNKPGTGWYQNLTDRKGNPVTDLEELGLDLDDQFGKVFLDLRTQMLKQTSSAKTVEEAEEIFEKYSRYVENAKKYSETTAVSLGLLETPDYSMYRLAKPDTVNLPRMDEAAKLELGDYQNKEVADLKAEIKKIEAAIDRLYKSDRPNQSAADKLFEKLDRLDAALKAATNDAETAYSNNLVNYANIGSVKTWKHSGVDLDAVKVSLVSSGEAFSNELISSLDYVHPDLLKAVDWERVVLFSSADQGIPDSIKQDLEAYEIGGFSARVDGMDYIWVSEYSLETPLIAHEVFHTAVRQNPAMLDNVVKSLDRTVLEAYPLWESFKPVYEEAVSTFSKYAGSNPVAFFEDTKFLFAQMVNQLEQQVYDSPSWASGTYLFWMGLQSVSNAWIDAGGFMSFKTLLDASRAVESVDEIVGRNLVEELAAYRLNWNPEYYDDLARLNPPKIPDALTLVNKSYVDYLGGSQPIKLGSLLDQNAKLAEQIVSESDLVPNGVTLGEDSSLAASVGNSKPIEELASRLKNTGGADVVLPESVTAGYTKQDHSPSLIESVMAQYHKEGTTSGFYRVKAILDYVPGSVLTSFYKEGLTLLHLDDLRQLEGLADHFVRLQNDPMYISFGNILVTSDDIGVLTKEMNHVEASLDDVADILGQLEPYRNDPLLQAVGLNLPKFQKKVLEGHSELSLKDKLADWLLRMYQDLGYMWINQLLRKGPTYFADLYPNSDASERAFYIKKGEILSRLIPHIDEALNSAAIAPTMQQDKVYRGFTNPKLSFKKGDVVSHPFYLSTSQELTVAQGFSGPESWLFEIKGVKGPKLAKDFESEVLLPRNTELRVTDVQGYKVTLEYIGPPVNPKRKALLEGTAEPTAKPVEPEPTKTEDGPKPLESFVEGATSAEDVYKAYYVANSGGEKAWDNYKKQMTGLKGEKGWNKIVNDWFKKYKKTTGVDIKFSRTLSRPANLSESTAIGEPAYASYDTGTEKLRLTRTDEEVGSTNAGVNRQGGLGTGSSVSASSPDVGNSVDTRQFGTTNDYGPGVYATTSRDRAAQYANSIGHTKPGTVYGNPSVDSYRVKPGTTYARTTQRWLDLHTRRDYDGLAKLNQEALDAGIQVLITPKEDFIILDPNAVDHSGRSAIEPLDSAYAMRVSEYNARMDSGLPTDEIRMAAAEQGIFELGKHYEDILVSAGNKWFDEASAELGEFTNLRQQAKQDLKGVSTVSEQFSKAWEETQKCL